MQNTKRQRWKEDNRRRPTPGPSTALVTSKPPSLTRSRPLHSLSAFGLFPFPFSLLLLIASADCSSLLQRNLGILPSLALVLSANPTYSPYCTHLSTRPTRAARKVPGHVTWEAVAFMAGRFLDIRPHTPGIALLAFKCVYFSSLSHNRHRKGNTQNPTHDVDSSDARPAVTPGVMPAPRGPPWFRTPSGCRSQREPHLIIRLWLLSVPLPESPSSPSASLPPPLLVPQPC